MQAPSQVPSSTNVRGREFAVSVVSRAGDVPRITHELKAHGYCGATFLLVRDGWPAMLAYRRTGDGAFVPAVRA